MAYHLQPSTFNLSPKAYHLQPQTTTYNLPTWVGPVCCIIQTEAERRRREAGVKQSMEILLRSCMYVCTGCGRYLRTNGDMEQKSPFCTIILTHWNETIHRYSTNPPLSVYSMKPPSASTVIPMWLRKQLHAQIRGASCILSVACTMTSFGWSLVSSGHLLVSFSKTPHT